MEVKNYDPERDRVTILVRSRIDNKPLLEMYVSRLIEDGKEKLIVTRHEFLDGRVEGEGRNLSFVNKLEPFAITMAESYLHPPTPAYSY